jgi:hypothetical protein
MAPEGQNCPEQIIHFCSNSFRDRAESTGVDVRGRSELLKKSDVARKDSLAKEGAESAFASINIPSGAKAHLN